MDMWLDSVLETVPSSGWVLTSAHGTDIDVWAAFLRDDGWVISRPLAVEEAVGSFPSNQGGSDGWGLGVHHHRPRARQLRGLPVISGCRDR